MRLIVLFLALTLCACAVRGPDSAHLPAYQSAVADASRPGDAVKRDPQRLPREVLAFSGVAPADRVVEFAPGGGYYTAILSRVVGPAGEVFAVDPERLFEFFENGRKTFPAYQASDPRQNVRYSIQKLDALTVPGNLDQAWMVLYYHDTLWTGEDRAAMNAAIFRALKPGGVYLVLDHAAPAGSGVAAGREWHRMDPAIARDEIIAAGFVLAEESELLANAADPLNDSVFGESRRGRTSRFLMKFVKP